MEWLIELPTKTIYATMPRRGFGAFNSTKALSNASYYNTCRSYFNLPKLDHRKIHGNGCWVRFGPGNQVMSRLDAGEHHRKKCGFAGYLVGT